MSSSTTANKYATLSDRELTSKEVKKIGRASDSIKLKKSFQVRFLVGWIVTALIIGVISFFHLKTAQEHYLLLLCALIYISIGFRVFYKQIVTLNKEKAGFNFVLAENKAKFIRLRAERYIELPEHEDEGVHYLFQLADDRILSLGGQDFYPNKHFPSDDFEVVLCTDANSKVLMLEIYNYGKKIKPLIKIKGKEKWDLLASANFPDPENFTVIEGQLEYIKEIILGTCNT